MKRTFLDVMAAAALCALPSVCQDKVPLYRVTVVQRTLDAVNYQYHSGPTKIDFRGTVLLPQAKGDATVEAQKGRTSIEAKFEGLEAPQKFGSEYLSYVLWAISPDGAARNLGEIIPNSSNHGHLPVTTDMPAFGMIVTAEPYAAVREPSDVVVMENQVRSDTVGEIRPIQVKVELMPRGKYTWNIPASESAEFANAPKVSMSRYQAILQVYEAQNALGVARTAGAQQYAPDVYAKAEQEYENARRMEASKGNDDRIVQYARSAAQIADDARTIAERQKQSEAIVAARRETADAQTARLDAEAKAERERERADSASAQAQAEREARVRAEAEAQAVRERNQQAAAQPQQASRVKAPVQGPADTSSNSSMNSNMQPQQAYTGAREARFQLMQRLISTLMTRDTPQGLDVTLNDSDFTGAQLRPEAVNALTKITVALSSYPGMKIRVEGNSDSPQNGSLAGQRASAVASALVLAGVPSQQVSTLNVGDARPIVSNATPRGRQENRRVEIIISGDAIGTVPTWDRTYSLPVNSKPQQGARQ